MTTAAAADGDRNCKVSATFMKKAPSAASEPKPSRLTLPMCSPCLGLV